VGPVRSGVVWLTDWLAPSVVAVRVYVAFGMLVGTMRIVEKLPELSVVAFGKV
jgi:hypothetical protein